MKYKNLPFKHTLQIDTIHNIHYFEYRKDSSFQKETHNFWELLYTDKGEIEMTMDKQSVLLKKGDIAFLKPNTIHQINAVKASNPHLVVISFHSHSPNMQFFNDKILKVDEAEHHLLADILIEARYVYACPLDTLSLPQTSKQENIPFGAEQMIHLYFEQLLIHIIRRCSPSLSTEKSMHEPLPKSMHRKNDTEIFNRITNYMKAHLNSHITIEQICKDNMVGRSQLQNIFHKKANLGIIEYFSNMKINEAKRMIRTGEMNFTQISEHLGYTSIHYFSRQFKKITDMTPSEYASSLKAVTDEILELEV